MRGMTREEAEKVRPGDKVNPLPLWNKTERFRKLAVPAEVLDVRRGQRCQTTVQLMVRAINGETLLLSAGWFLPPADHDCALQRGSVICRECDLNTIEGGSKTHNGPVEAGPTVLRWTSPRTGG